MDKSILCGFFGPPCIDVKSESAIGKTSCGDERENGGSMRSLASSLDYLQLNAHYLRLSASLFVHSHRFWRFTIARGGAGLPCTGAVNAGGFALQWLTRCAVTQSWTGHGQQTVANEQTLCALPLQHLLYK